MLGSSRSVRLGFYISASLVCALITGGCASAPSWFRPSHQRNLNDSARQPAQALAPWA